MAVLVKQPRRNIWSRLRWIIIKRTIMADQFLSVRLLQMINLVMVVKISVHKSWMASADAIRAADPTMGSNHLESWDKTLKAFEDLGMIVGFLHARIHKLVSLSRESQTIIELKRTERVAAEDEMSSLNEKLSNVRALIEKLDSEIAALQVKNEELDFVFKEVAHDPW
ncbi:hypothetical protein Salat_1979300 [Sesamum alatum]|uniref:Uncharacterized protein n=1 Tax=Sesamum alatum TaxID=300844 RepID=A0AAE2CJ79_9LAMI|nr:hypothetical protein Salat_1979300 [Sesamum alatum]